MFAIRDNGCRKDEFLNERQAAMKPFTILTVLLLLALFTRGALHAQRRGKANGDEQAIRLMGECARLNFAAG